MASLLDLLTLGLGGQGGLLGGVNAPDATWEALRRANQEQQQGGLMAPGPAVDWSALGGTATPPISMSKLMAPGPGVDWSAVGGAVPQDQFGAGAQPFNPYTIAPPAAAAPAPAPPMPAPASVPGVVGNSALPPNAQYAQSTVGYAVPPGAQPQAPPPQALPPSRGPDVGDRLMAGLQNVLNQPFSPQGIGSMITGLMTGQRTDPVGATQQIAERTYSAMRQAGYSHPEAVLAATNPQVMEAIVKNAYQEPKSAITGPSQQLHLYGGGTGLGNRGGGPGAGPNVATIGAPMTVEQEAAQKAQGAEGVAQLKDAQTKSLAAQQQLNTLQRLKQLNPNVFSGPLGPQTQMARSLLTAVTGLGAKDVAAGDEFNALASALTLEKLGGHLGAGVSNTDARRVDAQVPTQVNSIEGRAKMIELGEKVAQRQIDIGKFATQYFQAHQGSMVGFNDALGDWAKANPMFPNAPEGPGTKPLYTRQQLEDEARKRGLKGY